VTDDRHRHGGLFIGILITVIGVVFLLDQMEIVHAGYVFQVFWPVILIGFGVAAILRTTGSRGDIMPNAGAIPEDLSRARGTTINFWGPVLIVIGVLWLISNVTHFAFGQLWPLWLIAIGVWLLINKDRPRSRRMRRRDSRRYGPPPNDWSTWGGDPRSGQAPGPAPGPDPTSAGFGNQRTGGHEYWANDRGEWGVGPQPPPNPPPGAPGASSGSPGPPPSSASAAAGSCASVDDTFEHSIAFMAFKRRITTQHFRYAKLSAVFGGFHLDFTMADMEGSQAVIHIEAVFGGGEIRVPPSWRVSIDAHAFGGAFMDETYARPDATAPAKVLIIRGSTVFGGVVIKN
jgi:hypothetical protein